MLRLATIFLLQFFLSQPLLSQWTTELSTIGTFSSIRVSDLNADGVQDIVIGGGREEFQSCDSAVVALDGIDGHVLWTVSAKDQIFGSALFMKIDDDDIDDVIIGGRSACLMAISGFDGKVLWRFTEVNANALKDSVRWFNFYNPQLIPDQNGDGYDDILISNGGDVLVLPHDPNRPPGYLVILDSQTGEIISKALMPDGKETYMSVAVVPSTVGEHEVVFGTGGETVGGSLYIDKLTNIRTGDLSNAHLLYNFENKGFVGPPSLADLNDDGILDIITNAVDGHVLAFDGKSKEVLWKVTIPHTESYSSSSIGYYNEDDVPDVFVSFGKGVWPHLGWGVQKMINGKTGAIEYSDSLGFYQNASPLSVDLNNDGIDEVIMSLNYQKVDSVYRKYFYTTLIAKEFGTKEVIRIANNLEGSNLSSTPWVGDLDNDGMLDVIYCHGTNLRHTYTFDGIKIHLLKTSIRVPSNGIWGAYQGSRYNNIFLLSR